MPAPERPGPRLTRRAALVSVAAVGLVGCTPERGLDRRRREDPAPVEPRVDPDVAVAAEVLAAENAVLALVRATVERHPALADRLDPVAATHEAHTALLDDAVPEEATAAPTPSASAPVPAADPSPTASASPTASGSPATPAASVSPSPGDSETAVPRNRGRALQQVAAAEQDLATRTKQQAFKAQSGAFARVLGSMAASAAQHAALLAPTGEEDAS